MNVLPTVDELPGDAGPEAMARAMDVADLKAVLARARKVEDRRLGGAMLGLLLLLVVIMAVVASGRGTAILAVLPVLFVEGVVIFRWSQAEREVGRLTAMLEEGEADLAAALRPVPPTTPTPREDRPGPGSPP